MKKIINTLILPREHTYYLVISVDDIRLRKYVHNICRDKNRSSVIIVTYSRLSEISAAKSNYMTNRIYINFQFNF